MTYVPVPCKCPMCAYYGPPTYASKTSTFGWILFAFLLCTTCIGAPLGWLFTDTVRKCPACFSVWA